ncbi:hypothetical protein LWI28_006867 [Acer negundo]|uniref:Uncharacterized protein n=1 Tax=Acer negundo TaxID=4023 RepID=A0AAD5NLE2_ACENE|nr:hypothetical protein LWI28_006867 [Acer negundo]
MHTTQHVRDRPDLEPPPLDKTHLPLRRPSSGGTQTGLPSSGDNHMTSSPTRLRQPPTPPRRSRGEDCAEHISNPYSPSDHFHVATQGLDVDHTQGSAHTKTAPADLKITPVYPTHIETPFIALTHTETPHTPVTHTQTAPAAITNTKTALVAPSNTETDDIHTPLPPSHDIHTPPPPSKRTQPKPDGSESGLPDESTSNLGSLRTGLQPRDPTKITRDRHLSKWLRSPYTDPFRAQKKVEIISKYTAFVNDLNLLLLQEGVGLVDGAQAEIVAIHRNPFRGVMGQARTQSFQIFEKAMANKCGGNSNSKFAWLAGSKQELCKIVEQGFGKPNDNGFFKDSVVDEDGMRHLLLCRLILGKTKVVHPGSDQYHSGVDNLTMPKHRCQYTLHLTVTQFVDPTTVYEAFAWEFILSFILMLTICGLATDSRAINALSGVTIGATVMFSVLIAGYITKIHYRPMLELNTIVRAS